MKVLMLSIDSSILKENSKSWRRMRDYGSICDELYIIIAGAQKNKIQIAENVFAYGTSEKRIISLIISFFLGKKILSRDFIITSQDPFEAGFIGWLLARKLKIGLEIQLHGDFYGNKYWRKERLLNQFRWYLGKFVLRRADVVRVVSQRIKKSILNFTKAKIFKNPIFSEFNDGRTFLPRGWGNPQLLAVGNLVDVKNHGLLIEVVGEIKKEEEFKNIGLLIVGDGYKLEELKEKSVKYGLGEDGVLIGHTRDIKAYYQQADILVHPSLYEGWGRVVIEAAYFELPIIMTDVGLAGEIIKNEESGLIVPVNNKEALKQAILRLVRDKELRERLGRNAKKAVEEKMSTKEEYLNKIKESWIASLD